MQKINMKKSKLTIILIVAIFTLSFISIIGFNNTSSNKTPVSVAAETPVWDGTAATVFAGGNGSVGNPYQIANGEQLARLAELVNNSTESAKYNANTVYYKLTADILLNNLSNVTNWSDEVKPTNEWTPIGKENTDTKFKANFNGDGHIVSGIYMSGNNGNLGLFGYIAGDPGNKSIIRSVGVVDGYIAGNTHIGGIVGCATAYEIINSHSSVFIGAASIGGGIVGEANATSIINCYSRSRVDGTGSMGGIVGKITNNSIMSNSYGAGEVKRASGGLTTIGGLVGVAEGTLSFENNYYLKDSVFNQTGGIMSTGGIGAGGGAFIIKSFDIEGYIDGSITQLLSALNAWADNSYTKWVDGSESGERISYPVLADTQYTVEFIFNVDEMDDETIKMTGGRGVTRIKEPTKPTREDYDFKGWSESAGGVLWDFDSDILEEITTILYAQWAEITINLATPSGTVGVEYTQVLTASSETSGTFTFEVTEGTLPTGLGLSGNSIDGYTISGTPTEAGPFTFSITATSIESEATAIDEFTLTIEKGVGIIPVIVTEYEARYNNTLEDIGLDENWKFVDSLGEDIDLETHVGGVTTSGNIFYIKYIPTAVDIKNYDWNGVVLTRTVTIKVKKSIPDIPSAPTTESKTDTTITLVEVAGAEYSIDNGATWQDENVFSDLNPNTAYDFVLRMKETETAELSAMSAKLTVTTDRTANTTVLASPVVESKTDTTVILVAVTGAEYSKDGGVTWQESNEFSGLEPNTEYNFAIRIKETQTTKASEPSPTLPVTTYKSNTETPNSPVKDKVTNNSITLVKIDGAEYSIDGGKTWQDSNVFEGLEFNTEYEFAIRIKETKTNYASGISQSVKITTSRPNNFFWLMLAGMGGIILSLVVLIVLIKKINEKNMKEMNRYLNTTKGGY